MVGNIPNFTKIDVLRCFLRFKKNIGRQELAKELELGEGTVRTILETLKRKKLLDSTRKGHRLSKKGEYMLEEIRKSISGPIETAMQNIYPRFKKVGVQVRNAPSIKEVYKLRDIAVKHGADGAVILRFDGRLYAPESDYNQDYKELEKYFKFKSSDAAVIAFSNDRKRAENGALAIAIELSDILKKFMSDF